MTLISAVNSSVEIVDVIVLVVVVVVAVKLVVGVSQ